MPTPMTESLSHLTPEEFSELMSLNASKKSKKIFKNGSPQNANIVAANIFKHSNAVRIYAYNMDGAISDCLEEYSTELTKFLSKPHTRLDLVLDKKEEQQSKALLKIIEARKMFPNKVNIYLSSENLKTDIKKLKVEGGNEIHFMTGDTDMFRLEYNQTTKSAYFSFNNKDITGFLVQIFDKNLPGEEFAA